MKRIQRTAVMACLAAAATSTRSAAQSRKVVFVCEHGTVKSVVALEYFNRLARSKGLDLQAVSRGTHPESSLPTPVREGLTGDGFDVSTFRPRQFTSGDLRSAALVVAFDADVNPVVGGRLPVARWDSLPSVTTNYAAGRSAIRARVERLVDSLSHARATKRR